MKGSKIDTYGVYGVPVPILKERCARLIRMGLIKPAEIVDHNTFVVCREWCHIDGSLANPRIQFFLSNVSREVQDALILSPVGSIISILPNKWKVEIVEVYQYGT